MVEPLVALLLVVAAAAGGGLNAVAGGGSFFTFPALLLAGVPPIPANATSAVALWPGSVASAGAYRSELASTRRLLPPLAVASVAGGLAGAFVLLATPPEVFRLLVPWLLLAATLIFALAPRALAALGGKEASASPDRTTIAAFSAVWFAIAVYGGYFGGGMGFLMLAALAAMGLADVHAMNGLKVVMGAILNGVAIVAFAFAGVVVWPLALLMVAGSIAGGYGAARFARKVDPKRVRAFVIAMGAILTAYFFWRTYA